MGNDKTQIGVTGVTRRSNKSFRIDSKTGRDRLKPRREPYWHKLQRGGYVGYRRADEGGTWVARWRIQYGKQQYESLGPLGEIDSAEQFDEAQKRARDWFRSLGVGAKSGYTVKDAIEDYAKHRGIKNSSESARDARQRLTKHAVPTLGHVRLTKLTLRQVTDWRDSLVRVSDDDEDARKSKDGANRLLAYLKAALNLAYKKDIIGTDKAWRRVEAFKNVGAARKVFLNDAQIKRLFDKTTGGFRDLSRSLLLTGMRPGIEPAHILVEQLDAKAGTLELHKSKTGPRTVYLSNEALAHLKSLAKGKHPKACLHTKDDGTPWGKSHQQRPMKEAVKAAKLPAATTLYALRHTYISRALLAGVNAQVVAENCGTSVRMIEEHYAKFLKADRRAMFNKVKIA